MKFHVFRLQIWGIIFVLGIFIIACTSDLPSTSSSLSENPELDQISGTYEQDKGDGGICTVKVILEPRINPIDEISFELFCVRGAPSYNNGYAMAKILMAHNLAVYSPNDRCSIVFEFGEDELVVTQIGMDFDCGFGHSVYADGVYLRTDEEPPLLGCMRMDNPCGLETPTP